jgi:branched-chain amino acid transport system ATP-binding protein
MNPLLKVQDLSLSFSGVKAVQNVTFDVEIGSIVGLIGPNGAGKSTLLNCISRIYPPSGGQIRYGDVDILATPVHRLAGMGINRTFQNLELFPELTTLENVVAGTIPHYESRALASVLGTPGARRSRDAAYAEADELLNRLGLSAYRHVPVSALSFGIQKNVELARALAGRPKLLLLDEPAAGLNPEESRRLGDTIRDLRNKFGITFVMVEHDMRLVMGVCEKIIVLVQGKKILEGSPQEVRTNRTVIEVYLGEEEATHHA